MPLRAKIFRHRVYALPALRNTYEPMSQDSQNFTTGTGEGPLPDTQPLSQADNCDSSSGRKRKRGREEKKQNSTPNSGRSRVADRRTRNRGAGARSPRSRHWFVTLNNYTEQELCKMKDINTTYCAICEEKGEQKETPHLHAIFRFKNQKSFSTLKAELPRANIEIMRGTYAQALRYLKKHGELIYQKGQMPQPGKRTDLEQIFKTIDNEGEQHLFQEDPVSAVKYYKEIQTYRRLKNEMIASNRKYNKPSVHFIYGDSATGKTAFVYDKHGYNNVYSVTYKKNGEDTYSIWFDGYTNQEVLLLDEYDHQMPVTALNKLLDGYPCMLPVKGSMTTKLWTTVYICSNKEPQNCLYNWSERTFKNALLRRVNTITEVRWQGSNIVTKNEKGKLNFISSKAKKYMISENEEFTTNTYTEPDLAAEEYFDLTRNNTTHNPDDDDDEGKINEPEEQKYSASTSQ